MLKSRVGQDESRKIKVDLLMKSPKREPVDTKKFEAWCAKEIFYTAWKMLELGWNEALDNFGLTSPRCFIFIIFFEGFNFN